MSTATEPSKNSKSSDSEAIEQTPEPISVDAAPVSATMSRAEITRAKVAAATSEESATIAEYHASAFDEEPAPEESCPKCHTTEPWGGSSWCPECGYYPGVSEICPQQLDHLDDAELNADSGEEDGPAPILAPWVMKIIWINTGLYFLSIAARYFFVYYDNSFRGLTALALLLIGFVTVAFNHIRASAEAMENNVDLSPFDIVGNPGEMWRTTIAGLPKTSGRIVWSTVGISTMICGGFVIGGIDLGGMLFAHGEPPAQKPDVLKKIVTKAVENKPEEDQPETLEEALEQVTTLEEVAAVALPQPGTPVTCVVYGFMRDGEDDFGRILLAATVGTKRRHVATMPASAFPKSSREILAARLAPLIVEQPSVETQYRATWVRPTIGLRIEFSGWSVLGEMNDPTLVPRTVPSSRGP